MKKMFFILATFLTINGAEENNFLKWKNSLTSHYNMGDVIYVTNQTSQIITLFNENYFKIDDEIIYFHIGIVINPGKTSKIDLNRIVSPEKINIVKCCSYENIKKYLNASNIFLYYPGASIKKIEVGAKYIVNEWQGNLYMNIWQPGFYMNVQF